VLKLNALRIVQRQDVPLYVFGVNGRLIHQFATVDRASRDESGVLTGFQRDRVQQHIGDIRRYLLQDDAILPNAIVIAFGSGVQFVPLSGAVASEWGTLGRLMVPLPIHGEKKVGLIVDGQQRVSALADMPPARNFPVVVVAFASDSQDLQLEQFVLVNKTKPLPRDLLNELVPHVKGALPPRLTLRRAAATVVDALRYDPSSPFYGRIRGLGSSDLSGNISQAAVIDVIESSVRRRGVLSEHYDRVSGKCDHRAVAEIVMVFYGAVSRVWPEAWKGNPWTSRLVHGVGIAGVGALLESVGLDVDLGAPRAGRSIERRVRRLEHRCAWTSGRWPRLGCAWNELQNTSQDKRRLGEYLCSEYARRS
jgi:DGQHR domain-containing protein